MSDSTTIAMLGLPGGTLKIPAKGRRSMGFLSIIGAAVACESTTPPAAEI